MKVYGPYTRKDGRKIANIVNDGVKITISWPKYLYETHYNVKLADNETIDHIDGNFTNDSISNLRILPRAENSRLGVVPPSKMSFICPECRKMFERLTRKYKYNQTTRKSSGPFCSRVCAGTYNSRIT